MGLTAEEQWTKELRRILKARGFETNKSMPEVGDANLKYKQSGEELKKSKKQAAALFLQRSEKTVTDPATAENTVVSRRLSDFKRLLGQPPVRGKLAGKDAIVKTPERLKLCDDLLGQAVIDFNQAHNQKVNDALNRVEQELQAAQADVALPPDPLAQAREVEAMLERDDLYQIIARYDTWGNLDLAQAFKGKDPHRKVLMNILDQCLAAQRDDAAWGEYTKAVEGKAKEANKVKPKPSEPTSEFDRSRKLDVQASPQKVYKLAILGAGASAAYYIANNRVDCSSTVVIGQNDPWAGERGGTDDAVVNHPHNMIDPEGKPDFEGGLAPRKDFASRVAKVVNRVAHQCDGRISKVSKEKVSAEGKEHSFYKIATDQGVFFAQRVVSALGIGGHLDQAKLKPLGLGERTRDMDQFMRDLPKLKDHKDGYMIAVGGPNAAIDVITAIIRSGTKAKVLWFTGSTGEPAFLDGTDNDTAKKAYQEVASSKQVTAIKGRVSKVEELGDKRLKINGDDNYIVDEIAYGFGPDVTTVDSLFDPSCLEPDTTDPRQLDHDEHFRLSLEQEEKDPAKLIKLLKFKNKDYVKILEQHLGDPSLADEKLVEGYERGRNKNRKDDGPGVDDRGLEFIGGQEDRRKLDKTEAGTARTEHIKQVNATLPENVIMGDQLTSAKARIEASGDEGPISDDDVPLVAERGGVNFVVANQTVIATHIATCYPNIPPGLANYMTAQIVVARTRDKVALPGRKDDDLNNPITLKKQAEFHEKWNSRLDEVDKQFA